MDHFWGHSVRVEGRALATKVVQEKEHYGELCCILFLSHCKTIKKDQLLMATISGGVVLQSVATGTNPYGITNGWLYLTLPIKSNIKSKTKWQ